jgi:hypothetical protein
VKVVIEEIAYADVDDIAAFYEKQRKGTASYFVRRFSECVLALQTTGGTHRKRQDYHFCMVKKFPVGVFYKVDEGIVRIRGVMDCRRSPRWIRSQLRDL